MATARYHHYSIAAFGHSDRNDFEGSLSPFVAADNLIRLWVPRTSSATFGGVGAENLVCVGLET